MFAMGSNEKSLFRNRSGLAPRFHTNDSRKDGLDPSGWRLAQDGRFKCLPASAVHGETSDDSRERPAIEFGGTLSALAGVLPAARLYGLADAPVFSVGVRL
jgi:hypothetical protein